MVDFFRCYTRFYHYGCNVQDFSCQLQIKYTSKPKMQLMEDYRCKPWQRHEQQWQFILLPCTLLSCLRCPQEKGSWSVMSPSETAQTQTSLWGQKQGQTTGIIHTSIMSEAKVLTQTGPWKAAVASLSIFRRSIISDHHSWDLHRPNQLFFQQKWLKLNHLSSCMRLHSTCCNFSQYWVLEYTM